VVDPRCARRRESGGHGCRAALRRDGRRPDEPRLHGNSAYHTRALGEAGLFDESFGYGYDNDMSYRILKAGYALRFCPEARAFTAGARHCAAI